ncbi:MAG: o-succinylbenzoate synthase, partial [Tannerellaceae bacterium]|nr:o-succinylbenzoate synthase [Tannerellaceae bacterium]
MSEILIPPKSPGYQLSTIHYRLNFRLPSATSRGVYTVRDVWYVTVLSGNRWGVGECAPLKGLSCDDMPDYANILTSVCRQTENNGYVNIEALRLYPSILFGLETAFRHLETGSFRLWDTPFSRGETGIHINGLVWMAGYDVMLKQVEEKLTAGFRCIKLKVGAIGFEHELDILAHIRKHFNASEVELRLDANGAFTPDQVMEKLNRLSDYDIHSIEQPIRAGQRDYMAQLAELSPIPIALDEELIGCNTPEDKYKLINHIRPQYIVLKPSLHGGMSGCAEWIKEAKAGGTGYWITSALESNIGLNAIAQWCATLDTSMPQGLGTGALFTNNIGLPLHISYTGNADCRPALCWKETQPSLL